MQLFLASDHAGFKLKEAIKKALAKKFNLVDVTPDFVDGDDYPLQVNKLIKKMRDSRLETRDARGILVCGSGVGASIAANRSKNIRAAVGHTKAEVKLAREHNDINVLSLSGWNTKSKQALELIQTFIKTKTSKAERHQRRIKQLS